MANTTADKLNGILNSKEAIRQAIVAKGQECPTSATLASYAGKIAAISTGASFYKCASLLGDAYITEIEHGSTKFYRASGLDYDSKYAWCDGSTVFFSVNDSLAAGDELYTYTGGAWVRDAGSVASTGTEATPVQRWVGYKAVLSQGVYTFESTLTTDPLNYSSVTPVVGNVYTADALCRTFLHQNMPSSGLVFYAPLREQKSVDETGDYNLTTTVGSPSFTTYQNVPCMYANRVRISSVFPVANGSLFTWSYWVNAGTGDVGYATSVGTSSLRLMPGLLEGALYYKNTYKDIGSNYSGDTWRHCLLTYDGSILNYYIDGKRKGNLTSNSLYDPSAFAVCGLTYISNQEYQFVGYMAAQRIYNRILSQDEINVLASEFTPTV